MAVPKFIIKRGDCRYPAAFERLKQPPERLYVAGSPEALQEGIAIVGARNATPYGCGCARRFARRAARQGITVISGGARGCDVAAHEATLEEGGSTVVFLGGGYKCPYPAEHAGLFERIALSGGAVVSEYPWEEDPRPYRFRARNRLIACLARATLIVEAGLPSGTFSTADEALAANRDVLVVPGSITSAASRGANRLLYQGATPIIDDDTFDEALFELFGCLRQTSTTTARDTADASSPPRHRTKTKVDPIVAALQAEPLSMEKLFELATEYCKKEEPHAWLMEHLVAGERSGTIARFPDGRWGPRGDVPR